MRQPKPDGNLRPQEEPTLLKKLPSSLYYPFRYFPGYSTSVRIREDLSFQKLVAGTAPFVKKTKDWALQISRVKKKCTKRRRVRQTGFLPSTAKVAFGDRYALCTAAKSKQTCQIINCQRNNYRTACQGRVSSLANRLPIDCVPARAVNLRLVTTAGRLALASSPAALTGRWVLYVFRGVS